MNGLLGSSSSVTPEQIIHKISELGLATSLEALTEAGVNPGQAIGEMIGAGAISVEQVLDLHSVFQGGPDAVATAAQAMDLGGEQKFFDYFERQKPGAYEARDMSSARGSATDPKSMVPPPDAYENWDTNYS